MMASGPGILRYLTKESDNYTAFIKQLINMVITSAIDKYEKESCNLITFYQIWAQRKFTQLYKTKFTQSLT